MQGHTHADPLVSVILPTYNRAAVIRRAIQSVIDQTYPHWELLVVDDASTDDTSAVVRSFDHPRIFYVRLPFNCGHPSRPRNIGWLLARGVYIAYIDDDNAWRSHHLERLVAAAEAHPDAAGAYGGRCIHRPGDPPLDVVDSNGGIDTGDGLHRRDLITLLPEMWTETNFTNEDTEFWARLRQRHPVGLIWVNDVLSDYYSHDGNRYHMHWLNFRRYDCAYFERHSARLDDPDRYMAYTDSVLALNPHRVLDVGCGRGWIVRALRERAIDAWGTDPAPALPAMSVARPHLLRAAADRLPFPAAAFDTVLCLDVLQHIPEPFVDRSLRELVRVCSRHLILAIDCHDPTREGATTIRPHAWWLDRLQRAGAVSADPMPPQPAPDGLDLFILSPVHARHPEEVFA